MPWEAELQCALECARRAGERALHLQTSAQEERKADGSPVSRADREADGIIRELLHAHFPEDGIISEEAPRQPGSGRNWIVDPIDGTRAFLDGRDEWCVQIALVADGQPLLGVIFIPGRRRLLGGVPGQGAWLFDQGREWSLSSPPTAGKRLLLSRRLRERPFSAALRRQLPDYQLCYSSSVGGKVDLLLSGQAIAYVHPLPLRSWDLAAPVAVLLAAGGHVDRLDGKALRYDDPEPLTCGMVASMAMSDHHDALVHAIQTLSA